MAVALRHQNAAAASEVVDAAQRMVTLATAQLEALQRGTDYQLGWLTLRLNEEMERVNGLLGLKQPSRSEIRRLKRLLTEMKAVNEQFASAIGVPPAPPQRRQQISRRGTPPPAPLAYAVGPT